MGKFLLLFCFLLVSVSCSENRKSVKDRGDLLKDSLFMLVGGYADSLEEGVKLYSFDQSTGDAHYVSGTKGISNPSYLDFSSDCKRVFAVGENEVDNSTANVLSLDWTTGEMKLQNSMKTHGAAPCYIALSPEEDFVITANYNGGNISIFRIGKKGELQEPRIISFVGKGINVERQEGPHLHFIGFTPDESRMMAVDLGADCVHAFPINRQDHEVSAPFLDEDKSHNFLLPPGCGPRHLCFSADGNYVYIITELSGEVLVYHYEGDKADLIQRVQADTLHASGSADIHLSADERFLYASNRLKGDGIAIFKIDPEKHTLEKIGYQPTAVHPRNFAISPNGKFLLVACRFSNVIQVFLRDEETGLLSDTGKRIETSQPSCVKFITKP